VLINQAYLSKYNAANQ